MADQDVHEIQLSGKQLVFLFMSAVVVAVVIFLLGVSFGRSARGGAISGPTVSAEAGAPPDATPATEPAAQGQGAPNDLSYHDLLQGKRQAGAGDPTKAAEPPTPAAEAPPQTPPQTAPQPPQTPPTTPANTPSQTTAKPAVPAAKPTAAPAKNASASTANGWFVQVGAFSSNDAAGREVSKLKAKGYPALVLSPSSSPSISLYRVRVGPYADRSEAQRAASRLEKEGYKPQVQQQR